MKLDRVHHALGLQLDGIQLVSIRRFAPTFQISVATPTVRRPSAAATALLDVLHSRGGVARRHLGSIDGVTHSIGSVKRGSTIYTGASEVLVLRAERNGDDTGKPLAS